MERTQNLTTAAAPAGAPEGSYIDWPAILAGAAIAATIGTLATAFGAAVGLSAVSLDTEGGSGTLSLILGALWTVITLVASYAVGGYVTGRMRRRVDQASADEVTVRDGMNGLAVWAVGMLVGLMLLANAAGNVASATASAAGTAVTAAGSAVGGLAQGAMTAATAIAGSGDTTNSMTYVTDTLLRPSPASTASASTEEATRQVGSILANVVATGEISDAERAYLERTVAVRTGLSAAEVTSQVDAAIASANAAREEAAATAERAKAEALQIAETARISAVLTAFLLTAASLVAAAAATGAAVRGGLHRDEGRAYAGLTFKR